MTRPPSYRAVLRDPELRVLLLASFVSSAGDVLARYALAYLVFERTGSAAKGAVAFGVTFLSALVGGPLFAGWTDRAPARTVMVVTDVVRGLGLLLMTLVGGPLWVLVALLFAITTLESPFDAARTVTFADVLPVQEEYTRGLVADRIVYQGSQVLGFGLGAAVVSAVGARVALGLDAGSFAVSAGLLLGLVRLRPARETEARAHRGLRQVVADAGTGWRAVLTVPPLRRATLLAWTSAGLGIAPEAVVVPLAVALGATKADGGYLLLANPVGYILTALWVAARPAALQRRLLAPLALLTAVPLVLFALRPPLAVGVLVFGLTGVGLASLIVYRGELVAWSPPSARGRVASIVGSTLLVLQGVGSAGAGLLVQGAGATKAVALVGLVLAALVVLGAVSGGGGWSGRSPSGVTDAA